MSVDHERTAGQMPVLSELDSCFPYKKPTGGGLALSHHTVKQIAMCPCA